MSVTVYSKPNCQPCVATKRQLDKFGIDYTEIDVSTSPSALRFAASLGHQQTPVVYVDSDNHWSGFRPDRIKALAA